MFTSAPDLKRKLLRYIREYNKEPKTVKWKYFDPTRRMTPQSTVTVHLVGIVGWSRSLRELIVRMKNALVDNGWRSMMTPASLFGAAVSARTAAVISKIHTERHLLVFVPVDLHCGSSSAVPVARMDR